MLITTNTISAESRLPRKQATPELEKAVAEFIQAAKDEDTGMHSVMVVKDGIVVAEHYMGEGAPDKPHFMWSVSKTWTGTAVGFAIDEGKLKLNDKVISFFPNQIPEKVSKNLASLRVKDLLCMSTGMEKEATLKVWNAKHWEKARFIEDDWVKIFLSEPVVNKPGEKFRYNTMASFMLSAIVQKVTGEKIVDYLTPDYSNHSKWRNLDGTRTIRV